MTDQCHPSHVTRVSIDASSFDEICVFCGHTDRLGGWGKLAEPCPKVLTLTDVTAVLANEDPAMILDTYGIDVATLTEEQVAQRQDVFKRLLRRYGGWA